jgi:AcrR family transcriptional regulator
VARVIDPADRRREIAQAALKLLARNGVRGLTMRALAAELQGSLTLVTHYYRSRSEILTDLATQLSAAWRDELEELERPANDPWTRLRTLLEWLLPMTPEGREEERARFALVIGRDDHECARVLAEFDSDMRSLIAAHVSELVPPDVVEKVTALLRATTSGVVFEDYLDEGAWPEHRQLELVDDLIEWVSAQAVRFKAPTGRVGSR